MIYTGDGSTSITRKMFRKFFGFLSIFWLTGSVYALPLSVDGQELPTLANVVEKVEKGIVNISTKGDRSSFGGDFPRQQLEEFFQNDEFLRRYFGFNDRRQVPRNLNLGSGVIINSGKGLIVTNAHVLRYASEIQVTLSDGRATNAKIVGTDPDMDLALLAIDEDKLSAVKIGDSDELRVGDFVLAVGNNYGLSSTVTSGIISALGRSGLALEQYQEFIQTDAAINPGSSGGALVNLRGEVIGINTAILSPGGGNIGIGFAIPINTVANIVDQITRFGKVQRGVLGIHFQELTSELADAFGMENIQGVLVSRVMQGSAAEQAGVQDGDILTHVNGEKIIDGSQLRTIIALIRVGETVEIEFVRNNRSFQGEGVIGLLTSLSLSGGQISPEFDGAEFQNAENPQDPDLQGVLVRSVRKGSNAWQNGIREDDIIVEVNQHRVKAVDEFISVVRQKDDALVLKISRMGQSRYMVIG